MNWGKKLIIGMVLFMIFIVSLGAIMIMRNGDDALIENDYYEKGQNFNKDYQLKQNAIDDEVIPAIVVNEYGIIITFPVPVKYQMLFRRPSDYHMDKMMNGFTDEDRKVQIAKGQLEPGRWMMRIQYTAKGKDYLFETEIEMP
ncbi:MAG: nitrogen fixation protein FixH [Sphingobacteriaceae bacterium]|jgi:nitrogen fixation protein FixH|nr:nitrogen fixation protein FixH [Sphingobacteriaceae bacterium]